MRLLLKNVPVLRKVFNIRDFLPLPLSSGGPPGASISLWSEVPGPSCQGRLRGGNEAMSMPWSEEERSRLAGECPS